MTHPVDIAIVGAEKAGTSSLVRYLGQHPRVITHAQLEMLYFINDEEYAAGYDAAYARYFLEPRPADPVVLAKSVGLMFYPAAQERLYAHNPHVRLVAMLRNPITRAYSAYWWARQMGREPLTTFEAALDAEPARVREGGDAARYCSYLTRGEYAAQLRRLNARFGADAVQVFLVEDLKRDAVGMCRSILAAAGVSDVASWSPVTEKKHNKGAAARSERLARLMSAPGSAARTVARLMPRKLVQAMRDRVYEWNARDFTPPPMNAETRARLRSHFAPHNAELAALLGRDLRSWDAE